MSVPPPGINVPCPTAAGSSLYICVVYNPPKDPKADALLDHIVFTIDRLRVRDNKAAFIVFGDFNDFNDDNLCNHTSLRQIVTFPTHENSCLDKIITDVHNHYGKPERHTPIGKSKHCVICMETFTQDQRASCQKVDNEAFTRL